MNLSGKIFEYVIVFWSGVLVSFSPCVYPLVPITAGIIAGVNTQGSKLKGLISSLIYVLGLAITYCALATFAALTGRVFGQFQNHPLIFFIAGNFFILFALSLFDVIPLPSLGNNIQSKIKVKNLWTVLFLGMASGLVVGPCTAPVLGSLLVYVGVRRNVFHAISLLFVFSYGVGASLILVGTFSGILSNMPKSGPWLVRIKRFCGVILFIAGEYFLIKTGGFIG